MRISTGIDWLLNLPPELDHRLHQQIRQYDEEKKMPYISSIERIGREEGFQEGVLQGEQKGQARMFLRFLHRRFGFVPQWIEDKVYQADGATLLLWGDRLMDAERLESIFQ